MTNIADELIARRNKANNDQFGIPIPSDAEHNIDYACAQILGYHPKLHLRGDKIYDGHTLVKEDLQTCIRYAHRHFRSMNQYGYVLIWQRLKEIIPHLSEEKVVISDHLAFNRDTCKLEWSDTPWPTIV